MPRRAPRPARRRVRHGERGERGASNAAIPAAAPTNDGSPSSGPAAGRLRRPPPRSGRTGRSPPRRSGGPRRPRGPTSSAYAARTTKVPTTRASLSWVPKAVIATFFTGSGVRLMAALPTATTGDEAGPTNAATTSATPSPTAAASRPGQGARGCAAVRWSRPAFARRPRPVHRAAAAGGHARSPPGIWDAGGVPTPAQRAAGAPRPPPMPTQVRVAVMAMGVLAALLLLNAGAHLVRPRRSWPRRCSTRAPTCPAPTRNASCSCGCSPTSSSG